MSVPPAEFDRLWWFLNFVWNGNTPSRTVSYYQPNPRTFDSPQEPPPSPALPAGQPPSSTSSSSPQAPASSQPPPASSQPPPSSQLQSRPPAQQERPIILSDEFPEAWDFDEDHYNETLLTYEKYLAGELEDVEENDGETSGTNFDIVEPLDLLGDVYTQMLEEIERGEPLPPMEEELGMENLEEQRAGGKYKY